MARTSDTNYYSHEMLGHALLYVRVTRRGITRKQLAERSGVSVAYLRKLERGERSSISRIKLAAILDAMQISDQLFEMILHERLFESENEFAPARGEYQLAAEAAFEEAVWSDEVVDNDAPHRLRKDLLEIMERYVRLTEPERQELLGHLRNQ